MLFRHPESKKEAASYESQIIYFAHDGKIRGQFEIGRGLGRCRFIRDLQIYEQYRGQGYGNLMIAEIVQMYKTIKLPLALCVLVDNAPALHLYQKYGFKITSEPIQSMCYSGVVYYEMLYSE